MNCLLGEFVVSPAFHVRDRFIDGLDISLEHLHSHSFVNFYLTFSESPALGWFIGKDCNNASLSLGGITFDESAAKGGDKVGLHEWGDIL